MGLHSGVGHSGVRRSEVGRSRPVHSRARESALHSEASTQARTRLSASLGRLPKPTWKGSPSLNRADQSRPPQVMSWPLIVLSALAGMAALLSWKGRTQPDDWASLWIGGLLMDRGQQAHLYDADFLDFSAMKGEVWLNAAREVSAPFPHPYVQNPLFAKVLAWLSRAMSFDTSTAWLLFLSGASIVVLVAASYHLWFRTTIPLGAASLVTVIVLVLPTTMTSLWLGQTTPLIVAGVAYGLAASLTRPRFAGVVLGLVASIKLTPYALVVVMLFFAYRRRAALWALYVTAALTVWMLISVDMSVISAWMSRVGEINDSVLVGGANQSLASTLATDLRNQALAVTVVRDYPSSVKLIPLSIAAGAALVTTAVAWWNKVYRFEILVVGAWLVAASFSAIVWIHYVLMLVTPLMGVAAMSRTRLTRHWPYVCIAALVILLSFPVTNPVGAMPFAPGFVYSGITALLLTVALLLVVGGVHSYAQRHEFGGVNFSGAAGGRVVDRNFDGGGVGRGAAKLEPEPMILFDLLAGTRR